MTDTLAFLSGATTPAGAAIAIPVSAANPLPVTATLPGGLQVEGDVASGQPDSGFPVKVGGVFNAAILNFLDGQRADLQVNSHGDLLVQAVLPTGVPVASFAAGADGQANAAAGNMAYSRPSVFNGATWDRVTKPRTAYRLPASAATVNAANIKAGPGTIFGLTCLVTVSAPTGAYIKFFDTVGVPNPAVATPLYVFGLTNNTGPIGIMNFQLPGVGLYFPTGIGIAITGGAADLDATAIAAGQVLSVNVPFA